MQSDQPHFDLHHLSGAIELARVERGVSWAQISREVGVSVSTIRRFSTAHDAEADGVLALVGWLGVVPEQFVANSVVAGVRLPLAAGGVIRVDMPTIVELPAWPRRAKVGSRTTIQRLVAVAQRSAKPVASLTRWSPT